MTRFVGGTLVTSAGLFQRSHPRFVKLSSLLLQFVIEAAAARMVARIRECSVPTTLRSVNRERVLANTGLLVEGRSWHAPNTNTGSGHKMKIINAYPCSRRS
jgi:hypothetical protein